MTGNVRGLLCHAHNNSLGSFNDDTMLLARAIGYLAQHSAIGVSMLDAAIAHLQQARQSFDGSAT